MFLIGFLNLYGGFCGFKQSVALRLKFSVKPFSKGLRGVGAEPQGSYGF